MGITGEILVEVCLLELLTLFSPILTWGKNRGSKEKFNPCCDMNKIVKPSGALCPLTIKLKFPILDLI